MRPNKPWEKKSWGNLSLLLSGFFLIIALGARYILGGWVPVLYIFLGLFALSLAASVILDYRFYLEFFSMKTTKDSVSLGWSLVFLLIFLSSAAFLSLRFDKTFDLTAERLNSLAPQSKDILKSFEKEVVLRVFYNGEKMSDKARVDKANLKENLSLYKKESGKVKVRFVNAYKDNDLAQKYLSGLADKNQKEIFVFAEFDGRWVRVDEPWTEESITSALIKVKKREKKEIYFIIGHGERDLRDGGLEGLKIFERYLKDSGFILKEWSFIQDGAPETLPALVLVIGPRRPFISEELDWLKNYLKERGGRVFFALDPGERHNLAPFLREEFDIDFQNNFIVSQVGYFYGGAAKTPGVYFDGAHSITRRFQTGKDAALFDKASVVEPLEKEDTRYEVHRLLRSHQNSFTTPKLTDKIKVRDAKSRSMAVEVTEKAPPEEAETEGGEDPHAHHSEKALQSGGGESGSEGKEASSDLKEKSGKDKTPRFRLAVFGDSDFLSNKHFYQGVNRDLALNVAVSLLDEEELVTIRPRSPAQTEITLTRNHRIGLVTFFLIIPLSLICASLVLWHQRRQA